MAVSHAEELAAALEQAARLVRRGRLQRAAIAFADPKGNYHHCLLAMNKKEARYLLELALVTLESPDA
jgi:hypothetical protein